MGNNIKSTLELLIESMTLVIIFVGIVLGIEKNIIFFLIAIVGLGLFYFYKKRKREIEIKKYKDEIKNQWGKKRKEKRNFSKISGLNSFLLEKREPYFTLDDMTWSDLNMNAVFSEMDHTMSFPGMQYLYYILRKPIFDKKVLEKRNQTINLLDENKKLSQEIQYYISLLRKDEGEEIISYFRNGINIDTRHLFKYKLLSYLPFLGIILFFINAKVGFLVLLITIPINGLIYSDHLNKVGNESEIFKYLGKLINCGENILRLNSSNIDLNQKELKEILKNTKEIKKNVSKINYNDNFKTEIQILMDYVNMIFLRDPIAFYTTVELLNIHKEELLELYLIIGKIDGYISIASYKSGLDLYTEPVFKDNKTEFYIKTVEMYHPLLKEAIPYSFELDNKGILITGSNASGKSTFLRTIGINALLSQTLYMVLAKFYNASYFKLLTSIGTIDNIIEGDSYFMVEAKSLKRIIDNLNPEEPVLCILDEIFKGTNTAERVSAANQSLNYMVERNSCVIVATHDLELVNLVDEKYDNYHFKEVMGNKDIEFDYKLRKGPSTTRNAIAILKNLGYPVEIYENANTQAREYLEG